MLNSNKNYEIANNPHFLLGSIAAVVGAAIIHDYLKGGREAAARRSEVELCANGIVDADKTVIWFVGCMQDGQDTYNELIKRTGGVNIITPRLPEARADHTIDELEVCQKVVEQLVSTRARKPTIIADSRGALDAAALLKYTHETGQAEKFGGFGKVILNASPHDGEDITPSRNRLLNGAILLQHFSTPNHLKPAIMRRAGYTTTASAPLTKIAMEGTNIRRARAVNPLPAIFDELIYVRGPHEDDPTIYRKQASEKYLQDTPAGLFREYIDETRKPGTHIGGKERYAVLLALDGIQTMTAVQNEPEPFLVPGLQAA